MKLLVAFVLLGLVQFARSADILAVFPHTGKSHFFMFEPFIRKLAERGHHVTVITHFVPPGNPPNITYLSLKGASDDLLFNSFSLEALEGISFVKEVAAVAGLHQWGLDACETGLSHPNVQELVKSKKKFDLLIVEFFNTDCFASLSHVFNVPMIGIFSSAMMPWHNDRFGNPDNPAYVVNHFLSYPSDMTLCQRVKNTLMTFGSKLFYRTVTNTLTDMKVRKHLGDDVPSVSDLVKNCSLFLINSHFSLFQPRPLVPAIVELGGFHVEPPKKKIPAEVEKFINEAKDGVVYFSLGSTVRGSTMPKRALEVFTKVFSKLHIKVLWKWEDAPMPGKPDNVMLHDWFPQNEVLAHPNVKLFITHSGLMGTEEAVYHGVPMVMMPLFGDQPLNAASCAEKGLGVVVDYFSLTEESLLTAIKTVLQDKTYAANAKKVAAIFKDRPLTTMDSALYWTEYVIRYNGAPHLRSANVRLPWYSEYLIDVALVLFAVLYLTVFIIRNFIKLFRKGKTKQKQN